ncbi:MAG: GtrA family protein [Betaproteobacteria bacterium]
MEIHADAPPGTRQPHAHRTSVPLYIGAGGIATACHYAFVAIAVEGFGAWPLAATVGGFALGAGVKYWLNYFVAFRSAEPHPVTMARFAAYVLIMLALNTACFALLHQWLGLHYMIAQVLTTILLIPPGYVLSRRWVFVRS